MSSSNAVNNLNETINSFKSRVDVKIESVNTSTSSLRATTSKIYDSISKFKNDMIQNEEKQIAHENMLRIDQVLKEQFGNYEAIRKTVMGVVKDFDINLVRNSTMQELSEELWITSSRYWLSYALIAITAWVNDYPEVANNAISEGVRKDSIKSTLFFCLMNLRFARSEVASKWFYEYMKTVDPAFLQQEAAVVLQAYLNGIFGTDKELENEVNKVIQNWVNQLDANEEISATLTETYLTYIRNLPSKAYCVYPSLKQFCDNVSEVEASYMDGGKYNELLELVKSLNVELSEQTKENYNNRIDSILVNLITNYDKEELELKNQQTYFKMIIDNNGKVESAEQQYEVFQGLQAEGFNVGNQMVKWAVFDDNSQTDVHVRKFGLQNTRKWFKEAIENWTLSINQAIPLDFRLHIDTWSGITNGEDQAEQTEQMKSFYNNNKFQIMYVNTYNIAAVIAVILTIGLTFLTPFSLVGTVLALGFLAVRVLKARKTYPKRVNAALDNLNNCMNELADFKQFIKESRNKKEKLISELEYL